MERADARRLQPHYIESFFLEAFQRLGGTVKQREPRRYEVTHVPAPVRNRDRLIGTGEPFSRAMNASRSRRSSLRHRARLSPPSSAPATRCSTSTIDLTLERNRDLLRRGTVLVDENDHGTTPRVLFFLEHAIQDASLTRSGDRRVISKQMLYVELDGDGTARHLHYAPYLDYRPLATASRTLRRSLPAQSAPGSRGNSSRRRSWPCDRTVVPEHLGRGSRPQRRT